MTSPTDELARIAADERATINRIIHGLADDRAPMDSEHRNCTLCGQPIDFERENWGNDPAEHKPNCPWRLAREWVAHQQGVEAKRQAIAAQFARRPAEPTHFGNERQRSVPWYHVFHRWSQWERGEVTVSSVFKRLNGSGAAQRRHCIKCGKTQVVTL